MKNSEMKNLLMKTYLLRDGKQVIHTAPPAKPYFEIIFDAGKLDNFDPVPLTAFGLGIVGFGVPEFNDLEVVTFYGTIIKGKRQKMWFTFDPKEYTYENFKKGMKHPSMSLPINILYKMVTEDDEGNYIKV